MDICEKQDQQESFLSKFNEKIQKNIALLKGKGDFKLPSEAQWEYAARGGKKWNNLKLAFAGSQNIKDVAWYDENSNNQTMPVGLKQPNALGLYDMNGNVWEWCQDFSIEDKNLKLIPKDGNPNLKFGNGRVLRGGGFIYGADSCRVAFRSYDRPGNRYDDIGFRLVFP